MINEKIRRANTLRRKYFREEREEIAQKNIQMVRSAGIVAMFLVVFFILLAQGMVPSWHVKFVHILFFPAVGIFVIAAEIYRRREELNYYVVQVMSLCMSVVILGFIIVIDVFSDTSIGASYMQVVLVVIPILFILPFYVILPVLILAEGIYILCVLEVKAQGVWMNDIFNSLVGCFLAIVVVYAVMKIRVEDNSAKTRFRTMSRIDFLTGLRNKGSCEQEISDYLKLRNSQSLCGLMVLDVDNFKTINDEMGHQAGDDILSQVGKVLARTFRSSDIVGRVGGDEFMILISEVNEVELFEKKCKQIQAELKQILIREDRPVTCSIGMIISGEERASFEYLFELADDALYEAKSFGKNQYVIHTTQSLKLQKGRKLMLIADDSEEIRASLGAIFEDEFEILEAADGAETLNLLSQCKEHLSILLLDIRMPNIDGFEVLRYMKSRKNYQNIPVVVITADGSGEEKSLVLGADDMIEKPIDPAVVKLRVARVLKK